MSYKHGKINGIYHFLWLQSYYKITGQKLNKAKQYKAWFNLGLFHQMLRLVATRQDTGVHSRDF